MWWSYILCTALVECLGAATPTPIMKIIVIKAQLLIDWLLLSTHADRQGVDISVTACLFVCVCICTVTDFSAEDKASDVKFCTTVHRRPRQGISHFCELCSARGPRPPACKHYRRDARRRKRHARDAPFVEHRAVCVWIKVSPHWLSSWLIDW